MQRRPFITTLPCVGVTATDTFVAVCLRGSPIRLTGIYRCRLDLPGSGGRGPALAKAAEEARRVLRAPAGTPTVLALPPVAQTVRLPLDDGWGKRALPVTADDEAVSGLDGAGFRVERFDAVPAALARIAWSSTRPYGDDVWVGGWRVSMWADFLYAEAGPPVSIAGTATGAEDRSGLDLDGMACPGALRRHLRAQLDAGAIGAGLRGLGLDPDLLVDLVDRPSCPPAPEHRDLAPLKR
ncbi:MAG: hypothetical protein ACRBK7_25870 [Acidimicrobiales bacterium]